VTTKVIRAGTQAESCDVCGRTLLRGENADVFLHGGQRRTVCELCGPRAAHEGWIRDGLDNVTVRHRRGGRSRSFLDRLLPRRNDEDRAADAQPVADELPIATAEVVHADLEDVAPSAPLRPPSPVAAAPATPPPVDHNSRDVRAVPTNADMKCARALELFNRSEHPRRIAGIARSLGVPSVNVRASATEGSVLNIVVGWELSWYRYEVDLGNEAAGVRVVAQGTQLQDLESEEMTANAAADEAGRLMLAAT
jgi:hypothetical protein